MSNEKILSALGEKLKEERKAKKLSLTAVAKPAKISATYLQKLEKGIVKNPSPHVLERLSTELKISYLKLMELAGYVSKSSDHWQKYRKGKKKEETSILDGLSQEELKAVKAFTKFLKSSK